MNANYRYQRIPVSLIGEPRFTLRDKEMHGAIEALAKDIAANGQLQPILVTETADGRYLLDKGARRLSAIKLLGEAEIDARVSAADTSSAQRRRLQAIMATLNRQDYTPLERCRALAAFKQDYEDLYPETRNGGDKGNQYTGGRKRQNEIFSFSQAAAEAIGLSRRSIEISVAIWNGLDLGVRNWLLHSRLRDSSQAELRSLSEVTPEIQHDALVLLLGSNDPPTDPSPLAGSIADAILLAQGKRPSDPSEKAYRAVLDKWSRFPIGQKRNFIHTHRDEILRILGEEAA